MATATVVQAPTKTTVEAEAKSGGDAVTEDVPGKVDVKARVSVHSRRSISNPRSRRKCRDRKPCNPFGCFGLTRETSAKITSVINMISAILAFVIEINDTMEIFAECGFMPIHFGLHFPCLETGVGLRIVATLKLISIIVYIVGSTFYFVGVFCFRVILSFTEEYLPFKKRKAPRLLLTTLYTRIGLLSGGFDIIMSITEVCYCYEVGHPLLQFVVDVSQILLTIMIGIPGAYSFIYWLENAASVRIKELEMENAVHNNSGGSEESS